MQLHAWLLLFVVATDEALAFSLRPCGGTIVLHQEPAGHIGLASPGLHGLDPTNRPPGEAPAAPVCTWTISVPKGRAVLFTLAWADGGSSVSVRCSRNEDDGVLEVGGAALLSGCDGDKVAVSWTGAGRFSSAAQLSYFVQEIPSASSEFQSGRRSGRDLVPQTGPSATGTASIGPEVLGGTQGGGGRLHGGPEEGTSGPWLASSPSSQGRGPATPHQGLSVAGTADREAIPFPEEEPNNRAETSGAARLADRPTFAGERTRPYFQRALGTGAPQDTSRPTSSETSSETPPTLMGSEHETASSPDITPGTDGRRYTVTQAPELTETTPPAASGSSVPGLASSPPERASWAPRDGGTISGAISATPGETLPDLWTGRHQTPAVTSDPLKSQTEPRHADTEPAQSSPSHGPGGTRPATAYAIALDTAVGATEAVSFRQTDSFASDATSRAPALASSGKSENREGLGSPPPRPSSSFTRAGGEETQTAAEGTQRHSTKRSGTDENPSPSPDGTGVPASALTGCSTPTPRTAGDAATTGSSSDTEIDTRSPAVTLAFSRRPSPTNSPTPAQHPSSSAATRSSAPPDALTPRTAFPGSSHIPHTPSPSPSTAAESTVHTPLVGATTGSGPSQTSTVAPASTRTPPTQNRPPLPTSAAAPATPEQTAGHGTPARTPLPPRTAAGPGRSHGHRGAELEKEKEDGALQDSGSPPQSPAAGSPRQPPPQAGPRPSQESRVTLAPPAVTAAPTGGAVASRTPPKFYVVPVEPAAIRVESIELLLQIVVEESRSAFTSGLEEDATAWLQPYLQRAPGFSRLLAVWSSGHAVQSLLEFETSGALRWLDAAGPTSLLERTGLAQAVRDGRSLRSSKITNVTLGGLQADVCDWLLQCPAGYRCVSWPGASNYSCSSVCHFDHCHHHGICTHHPDQFPVCRCLVGEDFWYMGQRCDTRMTHARLVGTCLAILLIVVTVIGVLAFVAVRRYRAILIQAKVDQTRSSYRRFNHFDELSGRFWLRSWAGSADSLDNPAFTRSNELLHLRTLDRPCCYHDDTLSLASTCPSHGARINTVYLHSSQYGWRGSEMSLGDGVLDSGKASDLSVCSWPVEPIHWTPFPLLQQLASHRTPTVRVSRPRSYCEGMELVDLGKSWTA